jgi:hypothetical protein
MTQAVEDFWVWRIASFRRGTEFGRYRGMADIGEILPIKLDL